MCNFTVWCQMMDINFGFGHTAQHVSIPEKNLLGVLCANEVEYELTGEAEVRRALSEPIGKNISINMKMN